MKNFLSSFYNFWKNIDKLTIILAAALSFISVVLLFGIAQAGYLKPDRVTIQIVASLLGIAVALLISWFDYRELAKLWKLYLPASYILVLLTFFIGVQRDDDKAWLMIFGVSIQPAEILKVAVILSFALYLEKEREYINNPRTLVKICAHAMAPVVLILLQGDGGTALIMLFIVAAMIFAAGINWKYIAAAGGAGVLLMPFVWNVLMDQHKRNRVLSAYDWTLDPLGIGLQQRYGRQAFGSGGLLGKGLFSHEIQYVPEMYNDFIFTYLGNVAGFLGCLFVIIIIGVLMYRIISTSFVCKDYLGKLICVGVFAMLASQIIVNIGMCLSLLPVVGVTLPLLSSGGTSVTITYASIGLVLSVYANNKKTLFSDN